MYVYAPTLEAVHPLATGLLILSDRTDKSQWACCRHIKVIIIFDSA